MQPLLLTIEGPTAIGKSALALALAQQLGAQVLSADSRQLYRGLDIGTGKLSPTARAGVPHHFIDILSPDQAYNAAHFAQDACHLLAQLFAQQPVQVVAGGTGFYVRALLQGLDELPPVSPELRAQVAHDLARHGLPYLVDELATLDPATFHRIDRQNPARVARAIELIRASGKPLSELQRGQGHPFPWRALRVGLDVDRAKLHQGIDARVAAMFERGLVAEVQMLVAQFGPQAPALQSIGYREVLAHLVGEIDLAECIRQVQAHSRQYARRQLTWLRREPEVQWFDADDLAQVAAQVVQRVRALTT